MNVKVKAPKPFNEEVMEALNAPVPQFKTVTIDVDKLMKCTAEGKWVLELDIPVVVDEELNLHVDALQGHAQRCGLPMSVCEAMGEKIYDMFDHNAVAVRLAELLIK